MPRPYPAESRARAVALVPASKPVTTTATELGINHSCLHNWIRQDQKNRGELPGVTTVEGAELRRARGRIRQLELEVQILAKTSEFPYRPHPRSSCSVPRDPRSRRAPAELTLGMSVQVSEHLVAVLMSLAGIYGLPGLARVKRLRGIVTADDFVNRKFHRLSPNELWVADITQHLTGEEKVFCRCVLNSFGRRIVAWSSDTVQDSHLVVNALDMVIKNRTPESGGIVHADYETQFTSRAFTKNVRSSAMRPSRGNIVDGLDDAIDKNCSGHRCKSRCSTGKMKDPNGASKRDV